MRNHLPQQNGAVRHAKTPASPSFAQLEQAAADLQRRAMEAAAADEPRPERAAAGTAIAAMQASNQWQAVFAAARAAFPAPLEQQAAIARFGVQQLDSQRSTLAAQSAVSRVRSKILASAMMELRAGGRPGTALALCSLAATQTGDETLTALVPFNSCIEALVRCRIAQDAGPAGQRFQRAYWRLALATTHPAVGTATLVLCCGLSGSGKSFVANGVAGLLGTRVVSSDAERKRLAGLPLRQPVASERRAEVYGSAMTARVYQHMLDKASFDLRAGRSVVLDATFLSPARRRKPLELARRLGLRATVLWCQLDESSAHERLQVRARRGDSISDAGIAVRHEQRSAAQPPVDLEHSARALIVDTAQPPEQLFRLAAAQLLRRT